MKWAARVTVFVVGFMVGAYAAASVARELERDDPPGMEPLCTPEVRRVCTDFVLSCPLHAPHGTD